MIILRQKLFTRAEKLALEELRRATGGFKKFPGGVSRNLGDALDFKKLAIELNKGKKMSPTIIQDNPDIRKALDRLGLKHTDDKVLVNLNRKYNDSVLLARADSMGGKTITKEEYNRLADESKNLKSSATINIDKLDDLEGKLSSQGQAYPMMRFLRKKTGDAVLEAENSGIVPQAALLDGRTKSNEKIKNSLISLSTPMMKSAETNPQLKLINSGKKDGIILISNDRPVSDVLHEHYHNVNGRTIPGYENYYQNKSILSPTYKSAMEGIGEVAEENLASSRVFRTLRRTITPKERESLNRSLNTYVNSARQNHIIEVARKRKIKN